MNLRIPLKNGASTGAPEIFTDAVTEGKKSFPSRRTLKLEAEAFELLEKHSFQRFHSGDFSNNLARFPQRSLAEHCRRLHAEV